MSFILIDINRVLWSVSFFPFTLRWPFSSTVTVWILCDIRGVAIM